MTNTILALGLYPSTGGPNRSVRAFRDALAAQVISWVDPVRVEREPQIWGDACHLVRGCRTPMLRQVLYPSPAGLARAEQMVAGSQIVSCHSFWRWHNIWLQSTASRHSVPYWFVPHGALDPYVFTTGKLAKQFFLRAGGQRFLDDAGGVVCATRREYEKLRPLMPSTPHAIIPWPLADDDFRTRDENIRQAIRCELGVSDGDLLVLSLGRLHPMKRPLEVIRAIAKSGRSDVHLVLVGSEDGVTFDECRSAAAHYGLHNRVHVVGPAYGHHKRGFLDASDVYVSLSHRENFNYTAAEAMAAGLPVILSAGNDLAAEVADAGCGWMLAESCDPAATIAEAAAIDDARRVEMGHRARVWATAHLRFEDFAARIRHFVDEIAPAR